jgi:hypothetical protein
MPAATVEEAIGLVDASGRAPEDIYTGHSSLRRMGMALLIRTVNRGGGRVGLQIAIFSPWDSHAWIRDAWQLHRWRFLLWKEKMHLAIGSWAARHGMPILEGYSGGSIAVRQPQAGEGGSGGSDESSLPDAMEMAARWVERAVAAPVKTVRAPEDEPEDWVDVCHFKKIQGWMVIEGS